MLESAQDDMIMGTATIGKGLCKSTRLQEGSKCRRVQLKARIMIEAMEKLLPRCMASELQEGSWKSCELLGPRHSRARTEEDRPHAIAQASKMLA